MARISIIPGMNPRSGSSCWLERTLAKKDGLVNQAGYLKTFRKPGFRLSPEWHFFLILDGGCSGENRDWNDTFSWNRQFVDRLNISKVFPLNAWKVKDKYCINKWWFPTASCHSNSPKWTTKNKSVSVASHRERCDAISSDCRVPCVKCRVLAMTAFRARSLWYRSVPCLRLGRRG